MLAGLLTVLKIIGITLLIILGIVLLILLLVMFVPVRYRVDASVPETNLEEKFDPEKISFSAGFHWLLYFLRGGIDYPENKQFTVKVLWFTLLPVKSGKKDKKRKKDKKESEAENTADSTEADSEENKEDNKEDSIEDSIEEKTEGSSVESEVEGSEDAAGSDDTGTDSAEGTADEASDGTTDEESGASDLAQDEPEEKEDKALIEIISDIFEKIENILKMPQNVFEKIQYTISRVCGKIDMIKRTLDNDIFKRAFALVKKELVRLIKMLLPKKCDIKLMFGTGDPADTATVMAFYGALYPVLYDKVSYEPDFDRKVIKADVHIKGRITVFVILYCVLRCYFNKDVKKVIKRFKKIMES